MNPHTHDWLTTEVVRGQHVESSHRVAAVVMPRVGTPVRWGPAGVATYLRSVAKPFQTLALMAAGVEETFGLSDEELALVTASHAGEEYHHDLVARLLSRHGLGVEQLQCGVHAPYSGYERRRRVAAREPLSVLGNNCSGKHAGMLLFARQLGADLGTYLDPGHPVQHAVVDMLERFCDQPVPPAVTAVDGCGAPTFFLPLETVATAFWRLGDAQFLNEQGLLEKKLRLERAIAQYPRAFSGEGRLPYRFSGILPSGLLSKEGAEGVYVVWGDPGAVVLKVVDGSDRGYRFVVPDLLHKLGWIDTACHDEWRQIESPVVANVAGRAVGTIRVAGL
ncbi:MAG: asparaginase [Planctomycetota bacterium]